MSESAQADLMLSIDKKIGEVRTDALDLSFGEIINLKRNDEIRIDPEYQRLFRWSDEQRSRLVESVLLLLPIPPVFFVENDDGRYELIDGLQRISSIIQFIDSDVIASEPLRLMGCDIIKELNGFAYADLPMSLRLQLRRSSVRAVVIKRQSKYFLRYEMFKRLNTGGSLLSPQEIRNCSARLFGERGRDFYNFILGLSEFAPFFRVTEVLSDNDLEKRGREELVLRFFAAKNGPEFYHGHVADWLDNYMEAVLLGKVAFDVRIEEAAFHETFTVIDRILGEYAFCKYINDRPVGGLAPAYFEAVSLAFSNCLVKANTEAPEKIAAAVSSVKQSTDFRENVGAGANKKSKLMGRIRIMQEAIESI